MGRFFSYGKQKIFLIFLFVIYILTKDLFLEQINNLYKLERKMKMENMDIIFEQLFNKRGCLNG